jgi:hypothetical protein
LCTAKYELWYLRPSGSFQKKTGMHGKGRVHTRSPSRPNTGVPNPHRESVRQRRAVWGWNTHREGEREKERGRVGQGHAVQGRTGKRQTACALSVCMHAWRDAHVEGRFQSHRAHNTDVRMVVEREKEEHMGGSVKHLRASSSPRACRDTDTAPRLAAHAQRERVRVCERERDRETPYTHTRTHTHTYTHIYISTQVAKVWVSHTPTAASSCGRRCV